MRSLAGILTDIQEMANSFDGTVSIKNAAKKYFFVNQALLDLLKIELSDIIGHSDEEVIPQESAESIRKIEAEAVAKRCPIQYANTTKVAGREIRYTAIKWVVFYQQSDEPFCYCTIAHLEQDKQKVIEMQSKINAILMTEVYDKTDDTNENDDG